MSSNQVIRAIRRAKRLLVTRRFRQERPTVTLWCSVRLLYGLFGLLLLIFVATGSNAVEPPISPYLPTSWYWQWTTEQRVAPVIAIIPIQTSYLDSPPKPLELDSFVKDDSYHDSTLTWRAFQLTNTRTFDVQIDHKQRVAYGVWDNNRPPESDSAIVRFTVSNPAEMTAFRDVTYRLVPEDEFTFDEEAIIVDRPREGVGGELRDEIYPWGASRNTRDVRAEMRDAARGYLKFGIFSGFFGVLGAIVLASLAEWPSRPRFPSPTPIPVSIRLVRSVARNVLEIADTIPRLILIFGISAIVSTGIESFAISMALYNVFGCASLFRERIATFVRSEYCLYSMELGCSPRQVYARHLLGQQLFPLLLTQMPAMIAAYITWDCTIAFLGRAQTQSWGNFLSTADTNPSFEFYIALCCLVIVTTALCFLGDALKEMAQDS